MTEMGTTAINGILQAMTQRVRRQQELIDQLVFDLGTQSLENQALARELAVAVDEISRSNKTVAEFATIAAFENTEEEVDSKSRLFRLGVQKRAARIAGEKNES